MTICEVIEADTGKLKRIDFWNDNRVRVVQSHTYSFKYTHALYRELYEENERVGIERYEVQ